VQGLNVTWDWTTIAAIAANIGVAGCIIALIFKVYEVRHNINAIEGATVQSLMGLVSQVFANTSENAGLFRQGCADVSQLSKDDKLRFSRLVAVRMSLYYSAFVQFRQKLIDQEVWDACFHAVDGHLTKPGFRDTWQCFSQNDPKSFRDMLAKRGVQD